MSVEQAAQLMAERHVDALPVIKDDKVVGLLTEHDYFDKVLNARHQAVKMPRVCDVATMGSELVVARPEDTVERCLEVMMHRNLSMLAVVEHDGHALGTVSLLDVARQMIESHESQLGVAFSEPAHFPENFVTPDGGVHDEEMASDGLLAQLSAGAAEMEADEMELHERAAELFSEASVFPEFTPTEELLMAETQEFLPDSLTWDEREERLMAAHGEVIDRMTRFSEPSDFPEAALADEAIHARAA
ncbi:hypothetical protein P43SY_008939 [Pythium insidiosum]|uniref:CBS domain-containing protein n=1 Tax=Pythium insidiosum TaxID=114742 RepID=A0AAD5QEE5_PYTIN|nr:hypothetical protein P43SY_008939 [Pythium insidiosum]